MVTTAIQERRRFIRSPSGALFAINLLRPEGLTAVDSLNISQGGLCFRLSETLEVRSLVRLQLTPAGSGRPAPRPVRCTGRVAWVVQRLDLRTIPPFLYDVGVEFVDPPSTLRQLVAQQGVEVAPPTRGPAARALEPAAIRGRSFLPRLERTAASPARWHLVVSVDGAPCFSQHYPSQRAAVMGWNRFKRQQARHRR